jgi:hypothetical protein
MALLKPVYPYQENDLQKLREELGKPKTQSPQTLQSYGHAKYSHYRDTDGNVVYRYAVTYSLPVLGVRAIFNYMHTEATDYTRRNSTDMISGDTYVQIMENIGMGAGLGLIRYNNDQETTLLFGHLGGDYELPKGSAGPRLRESP